MTAPLPGAVRIRCVIHPRGLSSVPDRIRPAGRGSMLPEERRASDSPPDRLRQYSMSAKQGPCLTERANRPSRATYSLIRYPAMRLRLREAISSPDVLSLSTPDIPPIPRYNPEASTGTTEETGGRRTSPADNPTPASSTPITPCIRMISPLQEQCNYCISNIHR